tara:strand:- start:210 stop:476 length:267 start_codon:yes stop_codon:yes gene_type:complete
MEGWRHKKRPECLEKRFEFKSYEKNRDFLDALGDFCEKVNRFPDISFGKTYSNITVRPSDNNEKDEISKLDYDFATKIDLLIKQEYKD